MSTATGRIMGKPSVKALKRGFREELPTIWGDVPPLHDDEPLTAYRRTITPLRKRRSSTSSTFSRTPSGKNRFPLPTTTGQTIIWNSSTRLALIACAASSGPSTVMLCSASALSRRTAPGSNSRSILVRALRGTARVNITLCFIGYSPCSICVCLSVRHMTRGGVDEGRCKPQDTDDDGADGHPNVEPANLLGVCAPLGLLPPGAPWSCMRGGYHFLP